MIPIKAENLSFQYRQNSKIILQNIDLTVDKGEILAVAGLSGAGKSTLCYCLCGIIPHVYNGLMTGNVYINGKNTRDLTLPQIATMLGIVFQNPDNQLFSFSVEDEIAFGPENLCVPRSEIERRVTETLKTVGMQEFRHAGPQQLSGGQRQLISLAAVLSLQPEILIFDEAMSQIDSAGKKLVRDMILKLKEEGKTIIMVEHDFENLALADRILVLRDGRLAPFNGQLL